MDNLGTLLLSLASMLAFGAAPFVISGWMFGYTKRIGTAFGIAVAAFLFWTFVFAFTRNPFDPSWITIWITMSMLFLVPAMVGAFLSERRARGND